MRRKIVILPDGTTMSVAETKDYLENRDIHEELADMIDWNHSDAGGA